MTYCADTDIDLAFGRENARKWADVDNNGLNAAILARYEWARENAYAELNSRLATSRYQFPLAEPAEEDEGYPALLVRMEAFLAGVLMYESRGVTDVNPVSGKPQHALTWHRSRVDEFVRDVHSRRIALLGAVLRDGAVDPVTETPEFVTFDDPSPARDATTLADDFMGLG